MVISLPSYFLRTVALDSLYSLANLPAETTPGDPDDAL
jgi:hypothetical protein